MSEIIKTTNKICLRCKYNYGDFSCNQNQKGLKPNDPRRAKTIGCAYMLDTDEQRISDAVKAAIPESEWWQYCDRFEHKTKRRRKKAITYKKTKRGNFAGDINID